MSNLILDLAAVSIMASATGGYEAHIQKRQVESEQRIAKSAEARFDKIIEEEKEKVLPIYSIKGKTVESNLNKGRYVDVLV